MVIYIDLNHATLAKCTRRKNSNGAADPVAMTRHNNFVLYVDHWLSHFLKQVGWLSSCLWTLFDNTKLSAPWWRYLESRMGKFFEGKNTRILEKVCRYTIKSATRAGQQLYMHGEGRGKEQTRKRQDEPVSRNSG